MATKTIFRNQTLMILYLMPLIVLLLSADGAYCGKTATYEGRVVDADTLEPIEGARIVAIWNEWKGDGMLSKIRFRDARECLTDQDGKWSFVGPAGGSYPESNGKILMSLITGYQLYPPGFFVYKNWYAGVGGNGTRRRGFVARAYQSPKDNLEGIVLVKFGETEKERRLYREMDPGFYSLLLVPLENPEERLRSLDFNFEYSTNVRKISSSEMTPEHYVVHGLKKTRDVNEILNGSPSLPIGACEKLPITCKNKGRNLPSMSSLPVVTHSGGIVEVMPPLAPEKKKKAD
jgi:hypothetical protein